MIAKVKRGSRMRGLAGYLVGPGKSNEHTNPHLIAGDPSIMGFFGNRELGFEDARMLGLMLDQPQRGFDTDVYGGYVWHVPMSVAAREGRLDDSLWKDIVYDFLREMGYDESEGRAPVMWAAVHHGTSVEGNDHIHLVVNLVREDGSKCDVWLDHFRAHDAARVLETKYGLEELESHKSGRGSRGYEKAELATAAKNGKTEPARFELERAVRAAATSSLDEGEFVRRLRGTGVLVRPYYASGRTDVVTGYSVALRPAAGDRAIWYGGGRLAHDLKLPRLRGEWPDRPETASAAVAEWNATANRKPPVAPGREHETITDARWLRAVDDVRLLREHMRTVPITDRDSWSRAARDAAGTLAAWSRKVEGNTPGPLAEASRALAKSAHTVDRPVDPRPTNMPSAAGAAAIMMQAAKGGQGTMAMAVMLRQLRNLAKAIYDTHKLQDEIRRANEIAAVARGQLARVKAQLPALPVSETPEKSGPRFAPAAVAVAEKKTVAELMALDFPDKKPTSRPAAKPNLGEQPEHLRKKPGPHRDRGHNVRFE